MKIKLRHGDSCFEFERQPMPPERFAALCKLAGGAIGGVVLLVSIRMIGVWAVAWAAGMLLMYGFYRLFREDF